MGLTIDSCHVCRNRAELMLYAPDGRMVCGECRLAIDSGAVKNQNSSVRLAVDRSEEHSYKSNEVSSGTSCEPDDSERNMYLSVIRLNFNETWLKKLIREVLSKNILKYDWQRILENKRWFSTLDLRRFALQLDPNFEKQISDDTDELPPLRVPEETPGEENTEEGLNAN